MTWIPKVLVLTYGGHKGTFFLDFLVPCNHKT